MYKVIRQPRIYNPKNIKVSAIHYNLEKIGDRDIVGFGRNGSPAYYDSLVYPLPSIRWKENTPDVMRLRKIELGDWKQISLVDKKSLYRASFRQTYEEFQASDGRWKNNFSGAFVALGLALWYYVWMFKTIYDIPESLSPERTKAQVIRMLLLQANPVNGMSAKFDYEKWKWKDNKNIYFNKDK